MTQNLHNKESIHVIEARVKETKQRFQIFKPSYLKHLLAKPFHIICQAELDYYTEKRGVYLGIQGILEEILTQKRFFGIFGKEEQIGEVQNKYLGPLESEAWKAEQGLEEYLEFGKIFENALNNSEFHSEQHSQQDKIISDKYLAGLLLENLLQSTNSGQTQRAYRIFVVNKVLLTADPEQGRKRTSGASSYSRAALISTAEFAEQKGRTKVELIMIETIRQLGKVFGLNYCNNQCAMRSNGEDHESRLTILGDIYRNESLLCEQCRNEARKYFSKQQGF